MLDLQDYINQDFEVPDRYSMISLCSKGILSKVIIKNEINSADHWAKCILSVSSEKDEEAFSSLFTHFAPRIKSSGSGRLFRRAASMRLFRAIVKIHVDAAALVGSNK